MKNTRQVRIIKPSSAFKVKNSYRIDILHILEWIVMTPLIIATSVFDIRSRRAPDAITLSGIFILLALYGSKGLAYFAFSALGSAVGAFLLYFARCLTRGGLGLGDVKFGAMLGAGLGVPAVFVSIFASAVFALVFALFYAAFRKRELGKELPFVPFLGAGAVSVMALSSIFPGFLANL